jgi:hypothetical protein
MRSSSFAVVLALVTSSAPPVALAQSGPPPWARTETRADCASFDPLRQPYFGDTHVHTALSFDVVTGGVIAEPRESYDFAKGAPIGLPPYVMGVPQRTAQLRRPLDFTAVTDHSELFGETSICLTPGLPGYDHQICQDYRAGIPQLDPGAGSFAFFVAPYMAVPENPMRHAFCGAGDVNCLTEASVVWQDIQDAAAEKYDTSAACTFTTFVAYEYTRAPLGANLHRNVIFRNDVVPALPTSCVEEPDAEGLWNALQAQCIDGLPGCDVLAIPHNSNLSNGEMFIPENADGSPLTGPNAAFRARMEPLVEISQHKGDSECRVGILTNDELCGYEKMSGVLLGVSPGGGTVYDPRLFVRNALKEGLEIEESVGANPFRLGILASTDTHNAIPGATEEEDFGTTGHLGTRDEPAEFMLAPPLIAVLGGVEAHAGGLAVIWAEENSRDALFAAMRRREVYGTSGTRPIVRMFAGDYSGDPCGTGSLVETGYRRGVPMGGELGALRRSKSPVFTVLAMKDPGGGSPSVTPAPLQRIQIIKGWVNSTGSSQERVFEVAGDPDNGASVDTDTCTPSGTGFDTLCAVWEDPDFLPSQRAFYYARVVENPVCRWSTHLCNDQGVDCDNPPVPAGMEECCNPDVPKTIQERAWTSPIWYRPESFGKFKSTIKVRGGSEDTLKIKARMEKAPADLDPENEDVTITVTDDDTIYTATIPAGAMIQTKPGSWGLSDPAGSIDGLKRASVRIDSKGRAKLSFQTVKLDLSNADLTDHFIHTTLEVASFKAEHMRLWAAAGTILRPEN